MIDKVFKFLGAGTKAVVKDTLGVGLVSPTQLPPPPDKEKDPELFKIWLGHYDTNIAASENKSLTRRWISLTIIRVWVAMLALVIFREWAGMEPLQTLNNITLEITKFIWLVMLFYFNKDGLHSLFNGIGASLANKLKLDSKGGK